MCVDAGAFGLSAAPRLAAARKRARVEFGLFTSVSCECAIACADQQNKGGPCGPCVCVCMHVSPFDEPVLNSRLDPLSLRLLARRSVVAARGNTLTPRQDTRICLPSLHSQPSQAAAAASLGECVVVVVVIQAVLDDERHLLIRVAVISTGVALVVVTAAVCFGAVLVCSRHTHVSM